MEEGKEVHFKIGKKGLESTREERKIKSPSLWSPHGATHPSHKENERERETERATNTFYTELINTYYKYTPKLLICKL